MSTQPEAQRDELLAALKDAAHALEDEGRHYAAGVARAAIAKVTGEKHTTDRELMQQALEGLEAAYEGQIWLSHLPDISTALRERLAQPEQEPVAWEDVLGAIARGWTHDDNKHKPMDVQLAVAIAKEIQDMVSAPPQRKPLTDEKIEEICWTEVDQRLRSFARGSEAKLKEKNT